MPSLNALREFRSSFNDIANERANITSKELPFDDLELPKKEAPPFDYSRSAAYISDAPASSSADTGADPGNLDFSAFLNDIPGDSPSTPDGIDDILGSFGSGEGPSDTPSGESVLDDFLQDFGGPAPTEEPLDAGGNDIDDLPLDVPTEKPQPDLSQADEGSFPADLLSGFSDEMESAQPDFQTGDSQSDDLPADDFDINSFLSDDAENPPSDEPIDDTPFDFNNELQDDDVDSDAIDMGGESREGDGFELPEFDAAEDNSAPESDFSDVDFPAPESEDSIDMGGELSNSGAPEDSGDFPMDILGDSAGADSFDSTLPDMDFPTDDSAGTDSFDAPLPDIDFSSGSSDIDSLLGDMDFPSDGDSSDTAGLSVGSDDMGFPQESSDDSLPSLEDFGSDFASDTIDTGGEMPPDAVDAHVSDVFSEEFHIPGLDDMFEKPKTDQTAGKPEKKGFSFGRNKKKVEEAPTINDVEEIALSQDDLSKLLQTLSVFPLNLRIACEEIIAEQVILPQQLSKLLNLLIYGAPIKEIAALVEQITGNAVVIPKSFEKGTGAAFEAEQASFAYIFVHNFLPVLRLFAVIIALAGSVIYLSYKFVYIPLKAESIYKRGYERIPAGEYQRANDLFQQAFDLHRKKKWFYLYAEAFRDQRRYMYAEGKYDELLRYYPRDKKGVLDYADLETNYLMNYDKANRLLQRELLDYAPNDYQGLLAAGDNFLAWADSDPERFYDKYEDARFSYARLLELNGWQAPILERMLLYFIRTDNLLEVLQLRVWFENDNKRKLTVGTTAELGGYLLDKQLEKPKGVPNPYIESIESVRAMLLQAVKEDRYLPEPHYHLARYHKSLSNTYEERLTLENAIRAFDLAKQESVKRRLYRVDAHSRYAELLINNKEFFPAETQVVRGIELFEDYLSRNLIKGSPQLGQLYAAKGDLEFYVKTGDRQAASNARDAYLVAERYGYTPPDMLYRMGAANYQLEEWGDALNYLFRASTEMPYNSRLLYALGNAAYQRADYFVAQGYFDRLLDTLEGQRVRMPVLLPNDNQQFLELGERLMMARNNAGVVYEALAEQTGNREYRARAVSLYSESARAWDSITRNPETMIRMRLAEIPGAPGINLGYLNAANAMRPSSDYTPAVFIRIDRDGVEPSRWEQIAPFGGMY